MSNVSQWSTTAASNNSASPDGFPEGMAPSGVNDSAREVMASLAEWYTDLKGTATTGGTTTAYTLTTSQAHAALTDIGLFAMQINAANTGAATLAVDGLAAKNMQLNGAALAAGDLRTDEIVLAVYNPDNDVFDIFKSGINQDVIRTDTINEQTTASGVTVDGVVLKDGGATFGANVVSDTDSTDDLGTTSVRWANVYTDNIGDTGQDLTVLATTVNLPSGHVFDWNSADVTLTHSANTLTVAGGTFATAALTATTVTASGAITDGAASSFTTGTTIGTLTLANGSITDSGGAISFGNENLTTTGTLAAGATTINGNVTVTDAASPLINVVDTTNNVSCLIRSNDTTGIFGTDSNHPCEFRTNDTVFLTVDTSQNATFAGDVTLSDGVISVTDSVDASNLTLTNASGTLLSNSTPIADFVVGDSVSVSAPSTNGGSTLRLTNNTDFAVGYGTAGGAYLGALEFYSGDASAGTGVRAAIRAEVMHYANGHDLVFEVAAQGSTTQQEILRLADDKVATFAGDVTLSGTSAKITLNATGGAEFIDFDTTPAANTTGSVTSFTTGNSIQGFVRVEIDGTDRWMPY